MIGNALGRVGLHRIDLVCFGLRQAELDEVGLGWVELDQVGLKWAELECMEIFGLSCNALG